MMDQKETVLRWESKRWSDFQKNLEQINQYNSFQRARFRELSDWKSWSGFEEFSKICPLTTKQEIENDRVSNPQHGSNLTYPIEKYLRFSRTSGTSGDPITWMDTQKDWKWMLGNWDRILEEAGVAHGARCFFAFSFGPFLGFWTAYEAAIQRGGVCIPGGGQSTESRLATIVEEEVEYLFCTPTYAMRLIDTAKECGIPLQKNSLKKIIVAGECGGSQFLNRNKVDIEWGGESLLYDHYGMTEVGPVAYEMPGGEGGLRILLDSYHAEVIDAVSEQPVGDGELGELILTPLGRTGSPVLRYRTGDLVRASRGVDALGFPTFDLVGGILGRTDDMLVIRGVNLYPSGVDTIVRKFSEIYEYQVVIQESREMNEILIRAECDQKIARALEDSLRDAYSLRIPVESLSKGVLPRFEMKAKRWIRPDKESKH